MRSVNEYYINTLWLVTNVVAVVAIVTVNKLVFTRFNFSFGTLLTLVHLALTSMLLEMGKAAGLIKRKWRLCRFRWRFVGLFC